MTYIQEKNIIWKVKEHLLLPEEFKTELNLPDLVLQTLYQREITTLTEAAAFLDYRQYTPSSPYDFPDMEKGVQRVVSAIKEKERIGVWGDFDVDGQTSTAVLVSTLRKIGADVVYHIPVRGPESHGIQIETLKEFLDQGVRLIITCDTGISADRAVDYAQRQGVDVIVTDHHTLPDCLPPAYAVINPQMLDDNHKLRTLPGVGTALKFAEALLACFNLFDYSFTLHDLAALGIIADVAELKKEARYLVQSGLELMRKSARPAITAMLNAAEINPERVSEEHIAFSLAPRLNAVGRLSDAYPMVEFLLSEDATLISVTVNQLEGLNARRKLLCDQVFQGTLSQIEREPALLDHPILILTHPEWPAGIIGITASHLVEIYQRPVILFSGMEGNQLKGSARSVEGINITAAITAQKELLTSFGGHPMAAGLALSSQNLKQFQLGMDHAVNRMLQENPVEHKLEIDAFIQPSSINLDFIQSVEALAPFGSGNPPLVFAAADMNLIDAVPVGKTHEHLQMLVKEKNGNPSKLIWWQGANLPQPENSFDLAFSARTSNYRGEPQVQLEWINFRNVNDKTITLHSGNKRTHIQHFDYRSTINPTRTLQTILQKDDPQVWKEGSDAYEIKGYSRIELKPSKTLIIWSVPPDQTTLEEVILLTSAEKIFWFGVVPQENDPGRYIKQFSKSIKDNLINHSDSFTINHLASQFTVTSTAVVHTLHWLAARGNIEILEENKDEFILKLGGERNEAMEKETQRTLQKTLTEIQSYRSYYLRTELINLMENK